MLFHCPEKFAGPPSLKSTWKAGEHFVSVFLLIQSYHSLPLSQTIYIELNAIFQIIVCFLKCSRLPLLILLLLRNNLLPDCFFFFWLGKGIRIYMLSSCRIYLKIQLLNHFTLYHHFRTRCLQYWLPAFDFDMSS